MTRKFIAGGLFLATLATLAVAFAPGPQEGRLAGSSGARWAGKGNMEEYKNLQTKFLSNFLPNQAKREETEAEDPVLSQIDWQATKIPSSTTLKDLAAALDYDLIERQWFVTGNANPIYFSENFEFQDPDVKLDGIKEYAEGVRKLFNQETCEAQIITTLVNTTIPNTITCTWRLSGDLNIGPGLPIKPYIVTTDFTVDQETKLIVGQVDRFEIPQWDIFLSIIFPFLTGVVTFPPAPPVPKRVVPRPNLFRTAAPGVGSIQMPTFLQGLFAQK